MNPAAKWLIGGAGLHRLAETAYDLVMPLLILSLTGSPILMAVMFAAGFVAELVVAVFGGSLVDRTNRRTLLLFVTSAEIVVMTVCGILALVDGLSPVILILSAAMIDFLVRLYLIADTTALPRVVAKQELARANGLMQVSVSTATAVGPLLAGLIVASSGAGTALIATAAVFLLLFVALLRVPWGIAAAPPPPEDEPQEVLRHMWRGIRFTFTNPLYRQITIWRGILDFLLGASFLMFIYFMNEELGFNGFEVGAAITLGAVGAIAGGMLFARIQSARSSHALVTVLCVALGVGFGVLPIASTWWLVGLVLMELMFSLSLISRLFTLLFQTAVPAHLLGRVTATSQLLATLFGPLSIISAAVLAQAAGAGFVFTLSSIGVLILAISSRFGAMSTADWRLRNAPDADAPNPKETIGLNSASQE